MAQPVLPRRELLLASLASSLTSSPLLAAPAQPYDGRFWGNPCHELSLGNKKFRRSAAFRFRAEHTGALEAVRWELRVNTRAERANYSEGNGGTVVLELRRDGPGDRIEGGWPDLSARGLLAETLANDGHPEPFLIPDQEWRRGFRPNPMGRTGFQSWRFTEAVRVEAGKIYHLVWRQIGEGAISINGIGNPVPTPFGDGQRMGPYFGDDYALLLPVDDGRAWQANERQCLALDFIYADGEITGTTATFTSKSRFGQSVRKLKCDSTFNSQKATILRSTASGSSPRPPPTHMTSSRSPLRREANRSPRPTCPGCQWARRAECRYAGSVPAYPRRYAFKVAATMQCASLPLLARAFIPTLLLMRGTGADIGTVTSFGIRARAGPSGQATAVRDGTAGRSKSSRANRVAT